MVLLKYLRNFLRPDVYGPGYAGMFKQGFYEAPYLTITMIFVPISLWPIPIVLWKYKKLGGDHRRYMRRYSVYRPDDPAVNNYYCYVDRTKEGKLVRNIKDDYLFK